MPTATAPDDVIPPKGEGSLEDEVVSLPRRVRRWLSTHRNRVWATVIGLVVLAAIVYYAYWLYAFFAFLYATNQTSFWLLAASHAILGILAIFGYKQQGQNKTQVAFA